MRACRLQAACAQAAASACLQTPREWRRRRCCGCAGRRAACARARVCWPPARWRRRGGREPAGWPWLEKLRAMLRSSNKFELRCARARVVDAKTGRGRHWIRLIVVNPQVCSAAYSEGSSARKASARESTVSPCPASSAGGGGGGGCGCGCRGTGLPSLDIAIPISRMRRMMTTLRRERKRQQRFRDDFPSCPLCSRPGRTCGSARCSLCTFELEISEKKTGRS